MNESKMLVELEKIKQIGLEALEHIRSARSQSETAGAQINNELQVIMTAIEMMGAALTYDHDRDETIAAALDAVANIKAIADEMAGKL
jgi:hypothetical protein